VFEPFEANSIITPAHVVTPLSVRTAPGPKDISQTIYEGPTQPKLKCYPKTIYGTGRSSRVRGFQVGWFEQFKWLEYSQLEDAVYCLPCRFFSFKLKTDYDNIFKSTGYKNWKNALSNNKGLYRHDNSEDHKQNVITWIDYKKNKTNKTSVLSQLGDHHAQIVIENRIYLEAIIISLRMLAIQGSAFRGHIETKDSLNKGNFLELMNVIANFNDIVKKKITGPKNARYLHHSIQNEIIHIMASMILKKISSEVKECVYFSILADETKDISKTEQLSIVLRYFFDGEIKERFLGFTPLNGLDANSLFLKIKEMLHTCQIDINNCVAQTYDGASVMRGHINGVQTIFKKEVPQVYYMHCTNHRLNLVLVDIAKNNEEADVFFTLVQDLYVFVSGSNIHIKFIELQKQVLNIKPIELKRLCLTRWSSQIHSCKAIKNTIEVILLLLNQLALSKNDRNLEAKSLLKRINFKFVYLLLFFNNLLSHIHGVNLYLQDIKADITKAMVLIETTKQFLNDLRNEIPHKKLITKY